MTNIPFAAWEQAVFVVLFSVVILAILSLAYKIVKDVSTNFQKFIAERDQQWQEYLSRLRENDQLSSKNVVEALEALTRRIQDMQIFDAAHHASMIMAIQDMHESREKRDRSVIDNLPVESENG